MPRSLIRQATWDDLNDLFKAGVQPSWRMAPAHQPIAISQPILEYILDPRNTRFIVLMQLARPKFAPGSRKNITAVALLEKPQDDAPVAPEWSPFTKPCTAFTAFANLTATEVERRTAGQSPAAEIEKPEGYMHLHMLGVSSPGNSGEYLERVKAMLDEAWVMASKEKWGLTLASTVDVRAGPKLFTGLGFRHHLVWLLGADEGGQLAMMSKDAPESLALPVKLVTRVDEWFRGLFQRKKNKSKGLVYIFNMGENVPLWIQL